MEIYVTIKKLISCHINKDKNDRKIAIVGDSHTAIIATKLSQITDFEIITLNNTGCYYLPNFSLFNLDTKVEYERCNSYTQSERTKN